jgi:hypothetical protein
MYIIQRTMLKCTDIELLLNRLGLEEQAARNIISGHPFTADPLVIETLNAEVFNYGWRFIKAQLTGILQESATRLISCTS